MELPSIIEVINMQKYVGCTMDIIYQDRNGRLTQRRIRVQSVHGHTIRAYDFGKRSPRVFRLENILAVELVRSA